MKNHVWWMWIALTVMVSFGSIKPSQPFMAAHVGKDITVTRKSIADKSSEIRMLMIGNSLTYSNDLPGLIKKKANSIGVRLRLDVVAKPNYSIEDHWEEGRVQRLIDRNVYDYVILQQGPSSQQTGFQMLSAYGEKYAGLCSSKGSTLVFFMVWPSQRYYWTFDKVIQNYKVAASLNDALLCPVGEVWRERMEAGLNTDLYGLDGFHPSIKGSELAAEVIIASLFNKGKLH